MINLNIPNFPHTSNSTLLQNTKHSLGFVQRETLGSFQISFFFILLSYLIYRWRSKMVSNASKKKAAAVMAATSSKAADKVANGITDMQISDRTYTSRDIRVSNPNRNRELSDIIRFFFIV